MNREFWGKGDFKRIAVSFAGNRDHDSKVTNPVINQVGKNDLGSSTLLLPSGGWVEV